MAELPEVTRRLLQAKKDKGLSFEDLGRAVGRDEVWVSSLIHRQASASREEADKLVSELGLGGDVAEELTECPTKGLGQTIPTDPLVYRF